MADSLVPNVTQTQYASNDTDVLYGVVRNASKQVRDVVDSAWDTHPTSGSLDNYDISAGTATGGIWSGGFPDIDVGYYTYQIRLRASSTPDYSDVLLGASKGYWNGAVFAPVDADASGTAAVLHATTDGKIDTVDGEVGSILADTNELQNNQGNWLTATGFSTHSVADIWNALTSGITLSNSIGLQLKTNLDALISSRNAVAPDNASIASILEDTGITIPNLINTYLANGGTIDVLIDAIKAVTDKVDDTLEDDAGTYRFTENALEEAPTAEMSQSELHTALDNYEATDGTIADTKTAVDALAPVASVNIEHDSENVVQSSPHKETTTGLVTRDSDPTVQGD